MCRTEEDISMSMSSYVVKMCHSSGISMVKGISGWGEQGVKEGSWFWAWVWCGWKFASSRKGLLSQEVFSIFFIPKCGKCCIYMCCKNSCVINPSFLLRRLKINQVTELQNMHLFLDPLAWLKIPKAVNIQYFKAIILHDRTQWVLSCRSGS